MTNTAAAPAKLWIKIVLPDGRGAIGPGKVALLRAVAETGSIAAAARHLKMSYKRAWHLLAELQEQIGGELVRTRAGGSERGGADLTDRARELIAAYGAMQDAADLATRDARTRLARLTPDKPGA